MSATGNCQQRGLGSMMTTRAGEGDARGSCLRRLLLTRAGAIDARVRVMRLPPTSRSMPRGPTGEAREPKTSRALARGDRTVCLRGCSSWKTIVGFFVLLELTPKPRPVSLRPLPSLPRRWLQAVPQREEEPQGHSEARPEARPQRLARHDQEEQEHPLRGG